jgi:hypothetical protein
MTQQPKIKSNNHANRHGLLENPGLSITSRPDRTKINTKRGEPVLAIFYGGNIAKSIYKKSLQAKRELMHLVHLAQESASGGSEPF